MTPLEREASEFARRRHAGQLRKYTHEPYWNHLKAVATLVATVERDQFVLAASWLHDVVEDTSTTIQEIEAEFGQEVGRMVFALTDSTLDFGNREERKAIDRDRLGAAGGKVHTIKLADLIDNTSTIVQHDRGFARKYLGEKTMLLPMLDKGAPALIDMARKTLTEALLRLGP